LRPKGFEYFAPNTIDEAIGLLGKYEEEAKILAGGLSLVPLMKLRLAEPKYLIDINKIPNLSSVTEGNDGVLRIGALTPYYILEGSGLIRTKSPIIHEVASTLGDPQVRNRGTIGGNICHADSACEFLPVILALDVELKAMSSSGERIIKASDFFLGMLSTALNRGELLTEIGVKTILPNTGQTYQKLVVRSGDHPIVSVAAIIKLGKNKICEYINIRLGSVAPIPVKARETEKALLGEKINDELINSAAELSTNGIEPISDTHASSEYRTEMTKVMTRRALKLAFNRAGGNK